MNLETHAEDVRIEVDLILSEPGSLAGQEAKRNYLLVTTRGVEHWHAREQAILGAAGTLISRAQAAQFSDAAAADRYVRQAIRLQQAFRKGEPMANAVGAIVQEVA